MERIIRAAKSKARMKVKLVAKTPLAYSATRKKKKHYLMSTVDGPSNLFLLVAS